MWKSDQHVKSQQAWWLRYQRTDSSGKKGLPVPGRPLEFSAGSHTRCPAGPAQATGHTGQVRPFFPNRHRAIPQMQSKAQVATWSTLS